MQLTIIENVNYLLVNALRLYVLSGIFKVFFKTDNNLAIRIAKVAGYGVLFVFNGVLTLVSSAPTYIIALLDTAVIMVISLTYQGKSAKKLAIGFVCSTVNLICKLVAFRIVTIAGIEHIIITLEFISGILFFLCGIMVRIVSPLMKRDKVAASELFILGIIVFISIISALSALDESESEAVVAMGEWGLILLNIFVVMLIEKIQNDYKEEAEANLLKSQNEAYFNQLQIFGEAESKVNSVKHDLVNHLYVIDKLAEQGKLDEVQNYIRELVIDTENLHRFAETGNYALDSLLNYKLGKAAELGANIKVNFEISDNLGVEIRDISTIIGNLLDNAVTALEKCCITKNLSVVLKEFKGVLLIKVDNSYDGRIIEDGDIIVSTKRDKAEHGIGLKNIYKTVEKYRGDMKITYSEEIFSVKIIIFLQ